MAEQDDDARISEIRARHVAAGDPGDPHCAWCSGPDYPIWPCDVADLLEVIDAQRAIMDAQASVSEQHRTRVQELAGDLEHALASVGALRAALEDVWSKAVGESGEDGFIVSYVIPNGTLHRAIGLARGTDAGGKLLAERDALAARLAAAEAALFGVALRMDLDDLQGCWCVRPKSGSHEHACVAARAALAGSREQAAGEGE